jgi:hypothetical protein
MPDIYKDLIESYEAEEGYPSEKWIDRFKALPRGAITPTNAADFLVNRLPDIAKTISCMQVVITDGKDDYREEPLKRVEYITGGWSGAEDLIQAMLSQFWIGHYHSLWKRGGYFVFEVPGSALPNGHQGGAT